MHLLPQHICGQHSSTENWHFNNLWHDLRVISGFILPLGIIIPFGTKNYLIKQTDALCLSICQGVRCVLRLLCEAGGGYRLGRRPISAADFTLPGLVKDMRRHTPHLPPDGVHRSHFAFLSSVFANCVFPFFLFLLQLVQPNLNDIMLRGSRTEYVPTRPCRRTREQWQEGYLLNRMMRYLSVRKI